jgi:CDP-2,3-bis-(O-geranylgeranyl)-sn-glycerol synthase
MNDITEALWLFIPAGVANVTPVVANFVPGLKLWKTPIDINKSYNGKRILGNNKTWRGVVIGVLMAGLTGYVQNRIDPSMPAFVQVLFAMSIGFGALYGDAVESFFKRQHGIESGESWFPFDQIDFIIGGLIAAIPYGFFGLTGSAAILVCYFGLHLLIVYVSYHLGIRDRPI